MSPASPYDARSFGEFWPHYVRLHSRPETQRAHAVATLACGACILAAIALRNPWVALAGPLVDHAIAQASHRRWQRNRTTPWRKPTWHVRAELRMLCLVLANRMRAETARVLATT